LGKLVNGVTKGIPGLLRCGCPNDPSVPPGPIRCAAKGHRCPWCLHRGHGEETCELRQRGIRPNFVDYVPPVPVAIHAEMNKLRVRRDERVKTHMNGYNGNGNGNPGDMLARGLPTQVQITPEQDFKRRLIHFMSEFCSRGFSVREATYKAIKATADSYNDGREISVSEEAFEKLVVGFEADLERWKASQEEAARANGVAVGGGVIVEFVPEGELYERVPGLRR
jgi:hypothetical protein